MFLDFTSAHSLVGPAHLGHPDLTAALQQPESPPGPEESPSGPAQGGRPGSSAALEETPLLASPSLHHMEQQMV